MDGKIKVLFIGLGSIGQRHLRVLHELADMIPLWYSSRTNAKPKKLIDTYKIGVLESFEEAKEMMPDFAVIANPTSLHVDTAIALAEAKIPFLIEKPVSHSLEGLDVLCEIVARHNIPVLVGYNFRYHPAFKILKAWVQQGRLGNILSVYAELGQWLPDWHPDEDYRKGYSAKKAMGGGVVLDLSHEIDLTFSLLGKAKKVSAICGHFSSLEIETEDTAEISILHVNNSVSHIHVDYCQRVYAKYVKVIGEDGTAVWDYLRNRVILFFPDGKTDSWNAPDGFSRDDMFRDQMRHWLNVLKGDSIPEVTLEQGIHVTKIAIAAKQSSMEDRHIYLN